jgi:hypothetical protein
MEPNDSLIYVGRLEGGCPAVFAVGASSVERLHPAGQAFGWGADSGVDSEDLARALLTDASGAEPPADVCRQFNGQILRRLPSDGFALQRDTIRAWLRRAVTV